MKRLLVAAAAALTLVGPLAATSAYADPPRHERVQNNHRNDNAHRAWDRSRDNGYYVGNRFYRGAPSQAIQRRADFRPAWQSWRRGERLSAYERANYRRVDYRAARLRAPPRGYQYVRDDRNDVLLVAIATGVIASIIASQ